MEKIRPHACGAERLEPAILGENCPPWMCICGPNYVAKQIDVVGYDIAKASGDDNEHDS